MKDVWNILGMEKETEEPTHNLTTLEKAVVSSTLNPKDFSSNTANNPGWSISEQQEKNRPLNAKNILQEQPPLFLYSHCCVSLQIMTGITTVPSKIHDLW